MKYGPAGTYGDNAIFDRAYKKGEYGDAFLKMANQRPTPKVVEASGIFLFIPWAAHCR